MNNSRKSRSLIWHYFFRDIFDRSEKGILKWASDIRILDINYKGFTRLKCKEKCEVDFHPWCWKHKKEKEGFHLEKGYLNTECPTPDCNAFICKVSVFKEDWETPIEFIDDDSTKKILTGGSM